MSQIKRIYLSMIRRRNMTISMFLVILILGVSVSVSTSIYQSTKNAKQDVLSNIPLVTSINIDYEKTASDYEPLTLELAESLAKYEGVRYLNYVEFDELLIEISLLEDENTKTYREFERVPVKKVSYPGIMEIEQGQMELVEGTTFSAENKMGVLISKSIAKRNNLSVGDSVGVKLFNDITEEDLVEGGFLLDVIGIYSTTDTLENTTRDNTVLLMKDSLEGHEYGALHPWLRMEGGTIQGYYDTVAYYVLEDPSDVTSFHTYLKDNLPNYYNIEATTNLYNDMVGPLNFIESMSGVVLLVIILSGLIILVGSVFFFSYQRRREMGVYLAMGESKGKISSMFLMEIAIIAMIGLTFALFIGYGVSKVISPALSVEITDTLIETEAPLVQYEINMSQEFVLVYYTITLGITSISMLSSLIFIMRLKPQALLM